MSDTLSTSRMEAFSDGVIAVIITIMVLELKVPTLVEQPDHLAALRASVPVLIVYLLSFIQIGIYWVNHHYLLDDLKQVSHAVLIGIRGVQPIPVAIYCTSFVLPACAWVLLSMLIRQRTGVALAAGPIKQTISGVVNVASIPVAFVSPRAALGMIAAIAFWWLLPPRKILEQTCEANLDR
jgi:hypothetical protein